MVLSKIAPQARRRASDSVVGSREHATRDEKRLDTSLMVDEWSWFKSGWQQDVSRISVMTRLGGPVASSPGPEGG